MSYISKNAFVTSEKLEAHILFNASDLDPTFGIGGKIFTPANQITGAHVVSLQVQTDGKYLVGGTQELDIFERESEPGNFFLARYNPDGTLDKSFGNGGKVVTDFGGDDQLQSMFLLPDGKILGVGSSGSDFITHNVVVARYLSNGKLDHSFDGDGMLSFHFGTHFAKTVSATLTSDDKLVILAVRPEIESQPVQPYEIARLTSNGIFDSTFANHGKEDLIVPTQGLTSVNVRPNGKIVLTGCGGLKTVDPGSRLNILQLKANGALDKHFGNNGYVSYPAPSEFYEALHASFLQPDGKLVLAYSVDSTATTILARFDTNGAFDKGFASEGKLSFTPTPNYHPEFASIVESKDGSIFVGGYDENQVGALVFKFTPKGKSDKTFGGNGRSFLSSSQAFVDLALLKNGKILAIGDMNYNFLDTSGSVYSTPLVARINSTGGRDKQFGGLGYVVEDPEEKVGKFNAVAVASDGKIVAAGAMRTLSGGTDFLVERFSANGSADTSFGNDGIVTLDFGADDFITSIAVMPDGRIIVGGNSASTKDPFMEKWTIVRLNINGTLDKSFGTSGKVIVPWFGQDDDTLSSLVLQPDGKIIAAGNVVSNDQSPRDFAMVRLLPNGSLDHSFDSDGKVLTHLGSGLGSNEVSRIVFTIGGGILLAGKRDGSAQSDDDDIALVSYHADGSLNKSFGSGGKVFTNLYGSLADGSLSNESAQDVAVQSDGKIIVAVDVGGDNRLIRYTAKGRLDKSFSQTAVGGQSIALEPNGKIVAITSEQQDDYIVTRYGPQGMMDAGFGTDRINLIGADQAFALTIDRKGRIIVAGSSSGSPSLVRLIGSS